MNSTTALSKVIDYRNSPKGFSFSFGLLFKRNSEIFAL
ncbi:hypothetical protein LEP1GSC041_0369 [Leptospira noguchii str. 2006001870]|nr:hypothetical protein LEP1GSC041_0369 [Leptospira noguchii str. 2006001870]